MENFKKNEINIVVDFKNNIFLRSASIFDNENLRKWKNLEKEYFFFKDEIDHEMQHKWFLNYSLRKFDILSIVVIDKIPVGCMGIRFIDDKWDVYNVILGEKDFGGKGVMGSCFQELIKLALSITNNPVTLKVLKNNPAFRWYLKQGFIVSEEHNDYYYLIFNNKNL